MDIKQEEKGQIAIFTLKGRLDSNTSSQVEEKILSTIKENGYDILLNFSGLDYLSSAGIRILVHCHKEIEKKGRHIVLSNIPKSIEQVLYLTGFLPYFKIYEQQSEAVDFLTKNRSI